MSAQGESGGDRYEPLPSIPELPRYIWRRLPRPARIVVCLLPVVAIVLAILLAPSINDSKQQQRLSDAQQEARAHAQLIRRLRIQQIPRHGQGAGLAAAGAAPAAQRAGREHVLSGANARILADARERHANRSIRRVDCEPFPRTTAGIGAERDLSRRFGRYECLAVTSEVKPTAGTGTGIIGLPYRMQIDFANGRYAFCKISGRAGEGSIANSTPIIGVPHVCGGR